MRWEDERHAGYWRGSGQDEPPPDPEGPEQVEQPDRPERLEQQADKGHGYGYIDPDTISDKALLSFFGADSWDELRRARQEETDDEWLGDDALEPAEEPEQRLGAKLSSELGRLEGLSLVDFTPPQFRDRTNRQAEPEQRGDSGGQRDEMVAEAEPTGDEPREPSPTVVRWLTGHMTDRPAEQKQARQEQPSTDRAADTPAEADQEPESTRGWKTIAEAIGEVTVSELRAAAEAPDRNGLTRAGRALQKHSGREGSMFFGQSDGSADARNEKGLTVLDEILGDTGGRTEVLDRVINVWDSSGRGARFGKDGSFMGLLEPMP